MKRRALYILHKHRRREMKFCSICSSLADVRHSKMEPAGVLAKRQ